MSEAEVLDIIKRHKPGDTLTEKEAEVIFKYCKSIRVKDCSRCVLRKKYGKCPIVISLP